MLRSTRWSMSYHKTGFKFVLSKQVKRHRLYRHWNFVRWTIKLMSRKVDRWCRSPEFTFRRLHLTSGIEKNSSFFKNKNSSFFKTKILHFPLSNFIKCKYTHFYMYIFYSFRFFSLVQMLRTVCVYN